MMTYKEAMESFEVMCADVVTVVRNGVELDADAIDDDADVVAIRDYSGSGEVEIELA